MVSAARSLDDNLDAPVPRTTLRGGVRGDRMRVATALRRQDIGVDAVRAQIVDDRVGPLRRQIHIRIDALLLERRPDRLVVGVAVDDDLAVPKAPELADD